MESYHFIGIGGIGMSALARILLQEGYLVSGSDLAQNPRTVELQNLGATIRIGHKASHIKEGMKVVCSSDIQKTNPEYQAAIKKQLPIWHRSDLLAYLMHGKKALLVAGSHGKTTTSSLLTHSLQQLGADPSFAVGGIIKSIGTNGEKGTGAYFVAEADESDGTFLRYEGYGGIITNIGNDHMNFWKSIEALTEGFTQFAKQILHPNLLFWCYDNELLRKAKIEGVSYGFEKGADLWIEHFSQNGFETTFTCQWHNKTYQKMKIPLVGKHNVFNASAVLGLLLELGFEEENIRSAFSSFQGVGRRMDKKGDVKGIHFYDDYGHHPSEIMATLSAAKAALPSQRLVVVFQPHRYTRTRDCMIDFAKAFSHADELIVTDIYSAGEAPIEGIHSQVVVEHIRKEKSNSSYIPKEELVSYLKNLLKPQDVVLTIGAGDITKLGPEVMQSLL